MAAITKFLIVHHEVDVGTRWAQRALPLVNDIRLYDEMVDKLYTELLKQIVPDGVYEVRRHLRLGCLWGGVAVIGWVLFFLLVR